MSFNEIMNVLLFGYPVPPEMLDPRYPEILQTIGGLQLSILISFIALIFGSLIGFVLALLRTGKARKTATSGLYRVVLQLIPRWISISISETVRALPIMVLVLLVFYLPYRLAGLRLPPVILAAAIFSLYTGVYLSEIFRSGFRATDKTLIDAAKVLGLSSYQIMLKIKLPLALRTMIPSFLNIAITVFKDTSVLVVVAVPELMYTGRLLQSAHPVNYASVLLFILLYYWLIASMGAAVSSWFEKKWSKNLVFSKLTA